MAKADQILALIRSASEDDREGFLTAALQVAANEAKNGHTTLAIEIKKLVDKARKPVPQFKSPIPIGSPKGELSDLIVSILPRAKLKDMVLAVPLKNKINRILKEQKSIFRLKELNLEPRRKLLLAGPPGTGKTMTASVIANELHLPLYSVSMDVIFTRYMGEASAKLRTIFEHIGGTRGVYLFDEFDSIGSQRGMTNDVGEIRRVLNSFLRLIERDQSNSIIIAATNHSEILDAALFRRFDDVLKYENPTDTEIRTYLARVIEPFNLDIKYDQRVIEAARGLSFSELSKAVGDTLKEAFLGDNSEVSSNDLYRHIQERVEMKITRM